MDINIAHEASKRTLKQRNMLMIVAAVLSVLLLVMFMMAVNRDREVILQPLLPNKMVLSSESLNADYLEAVTRDAANLALNRSPQSLQYWMDSIVDITAPSQQGAIKKDLMRIIEQQRGSQITQLVTIDWIKTDPENLTSEVGGVLHTIVGSREVRQEHKIFQFEWVYTGVSLKLKSFGVVVRDEGEEG